MDDRYYLLDMARSPRPVGTPAAVRREYAYNMGRYAFLIDYCRCPFNEPMEEIYFIRGWDTEADDIVLLATETNNVLQ